MNSTTSGHKAQVRPVSKLQWLGNLCKSPASPLPLLGGVLAFLISHSYSQGLVATENREQVNAWVANVEAQGSPLTVEMADVGESSCVERLKMMAVQGFQIELAGAEPTSMVKITQVCAAGGTVPVTFKRTNDSGKSNG
jgi:hypothetical protein